ncbi:MAG: MarR family transcriptional regulator [Chloroflexi bacterium]|nr:MarR family transcriptional regulator [Chloroflexota bacterium]
MKTTTHEDLVNEALRAQKSIILETQKTSAPIWLELDLTMAQIKALFSLSEHESQSISGLAQTLGIGNPAASILVDRLVHLGYVERAEDSVDRRRTFARLSLKGEHLVAQLHADGRERFREWLDRLSDEDLAALAQGLRALEAVVLSGR